MAVPIHPYLRPLRDVLAAHADSDTAKGQSAYMKDKFGFFGIKMPQRRQIMRGFLKEHGRPGHDDIEAVVRSAWAQPQREFQYCGMELFTHEARTFPPAQLLLAEELILGKSWWDTVDHLAVHGVGKILYRFPGWIASTSRRYLESKELWLQRTALIFQLQYGERTDRELLFATVRELAGHPDFFIRKAIGWALRQYAYTDRRAVQELMKDVKLSPLSVREALKHAERPDVA